MSLVLGLGLEHSCPWPRVCLSSERLSLALASSLASSTPPLIILDKPTPTQKPQDTLNNHFESQKIIGFRNSCQSQNSNHTARSFQNSCSKQQKSKNNKTKKGHASGQIALSHSRKTQKPWRKNARLDNPTEIKKRQKTETKSSKLR